MQRSNFVETWEQYKFVIYVLLVRHLFGKTDISQDGIDLAMNKLKTLDERRNKTQMEIEYEVKKKRVSFFSKGIHNNDEYNIYKRN